VQSGFARTGKMFAIEHYDAAPDIVCMAKGIASGFPFSALGASSELMAKWPPGSHGGTYGGNAMGCAAALATIEILSADGFLDHVNARGAQLTDGLRAVMADPSSGIVDVRGLGLMVGTQFTDAARVAAIQAHMLRESRLITMNAGTYGVVLRWMPPLTVTADEIDLALGAFRAAVTATV
jgi:4-aminobutyrate aminotransferase